MLSNEQMSEVESACHSAGGYVPAAVVERIVASGISLEQLMLDLIPRAKTFAIPAISNFFVGAVAHGVSGNLYFGANYEFPGQALSFTVHGEQAATMHAISFGETGIDLLAVSAAPCGYCRQFLNELTSASKLQIILPNMPATPLTALLPNAFGPTDLGVTAALMSPQSHGMTLDVAADDVMTAALLSNRRIPAARSEALKWLAFVGLQRHADRPAGSMTISEQRRLAVARALATNPRILLMDEVMAGLNPSEVNEAVEVVLKIRDMGTSCLIVEHVLEGIMPIADKIVVLDRGAKIADATPQEISRDAAVIHAYLGDA